MIYTPHSWLRMLVWLCGVLVPSLTSSIAADSSGVRELGAAPTRSAPADFPLGRGFGVFVGINEFKDASLTPLKYAVNDALSLADYFVTAGLIEPVNCHVLISGQPVGNAAQQALNRLKQKGIIPVSPATRSDILDALANMANTSQRPDDFLVVSFSTHGFSGEDTTYVMPQDGNRNFLSDRAISLHAIRAPLHAAKAQKSLFIVDACRAEAVRGTRGGEMRMTDAFRSAFGVAAGRVTLLACDVNQVSYEADELQHGVFTDYLLKALTGAAKTDDRGFVTVGTAVDYVSEQVRDWVARTKTGLSESERQKPFFIGPNEARFMPLAVNAQSVEALDSLRTRRDAARKLLFEASQQSQFRAKFHTNAFGEIFGAFDSLPLILAEFDTTPLGQLIEMTETQLSRPTPSTVEAYLVWWEARGRDLLSGAVQVSSDPVDATVLVNGIEVGKTPLTHKLPAGLQQLSLNRSGFEKVSRAVVITAGQTQELEKITLVPLPVAKRAALINPGVMPLVEGEAFQQILTLDGGPGTIRITDLPLGLSFEPTTSTISGTPAQSGSFRSRVTVDSEGGKSLDALVFDIAPATRKVPLPHVNDAAQEIDLGESFDFNIEASGSPTSYRASPLPSGLHLDRKTGHITGRVSSPGTYTIALTATNEAGSGSAELRLKINRTTSVPEQREPRPVALNYVYTFQINGLTWFGMNAFIAYGTADGNIALPDGTIIGRILPASFPRTVGQLYFPAYNYYLQCRMDGKLFSVYPNGYWQPFGTWQKN